MNAIDWPQYRYRGVLTRAVDGDTVIVSLQLGLRVATTVPLRIAWVNAPERYQGTEEERAKGMAAWEFVRRYEGSPVCVETYRDGKSFDRYVATVFIVADGGDLYDLADLIIQAGMGTRVPAPERQDGGS